MKFFLIDAVLAAFRLGGLTTSKFPEVLDEMTRIASRHKIDMADMKKYYEAGMRSYSRVQWVKRMGLSRVVFRLHELAGVFRPSGKWRASMGQEVFADYLRKTETKSAEPPLPAGS